MHISVIIPAFNEERSIASTVKTVLALPEVDRVLVVDDGSGDRTAARARKAGAEVISHIKNLGKGAALNTGVSACRASDIVVFLDADTGPSAVEIQKLITPLLDNAADMTVAVFPPAKNKGGFGLVKALAYWGVFVLTGKRFIASLSGQRAFNRRALEAIGKIPDGFGAEVGITVKACLAGLAVREVAVNMIHRETKRDFAGFKHRGRQFLDLLRFFVRLRVTSKTLYPDISRNKPQRKT